MIGGAKRKIEYAYEELKLEQSLKPAAKLGFALAHTFLEGLESR